MQNTLTRMSLPGSSSAVLRSSPDWEAALGPDWPKRVMEVAETDRKHEKQGRSIIRWAVSDSLTVFLKRHFQLPRVSGLLARLFPGRAWSPGLQEWEHLSWARSAGVPVPRPVAAGEFRGPGSKLQSFLAIEELAGMSALHEAIPAAFARLSPRDFDRWKRGLIVELARLCRELHRRRAFHRDLYLCHFFIADENVSRPPRDWFGRVIMLDFHRLGQFRTTWPVMQVKDLSQFLFSSFDVAGIGTRDRTRFWKHYLAGDWGTSTRPPGFIPRIVRWKAANYARHNARHDLAVPRKD